MTAFFHHRSEVRVSFMPQPLPERRAERQARSSSATAVRVWSRWFTGHVHETPADLTALQDLLDRSYAAAGRHLLSIITPQRRLSAEQVTNRLTGMCLLALATVT